MGFKFSVLLVFVILANFSSLTYGDENSEGESNIVKNGTADDFLAEPSRIQVSYSNYSLPGPYQLPIQIYPPYVYSPAFVQIYAPPSYGMVGYTYQPPVYDLKNYSYVINEPGYTGYYKVYKQTVTYSTYDSAPQPVILNYTSPKPNYVAQKLYSPYQTLPGSYPKSVYKSGKYRAGRAYRAQSVYSKYLANGAYQYHSPRCMNHYGQIPQLSPSDLNSVFAYAHQQIGLYERNYGNFSYGSGQPPPLKLKEKEATLMEYVSEYFAKYKCLSKYQASTYLPSIRLNNFYTNSQYGDTSCYSSYSRNGKPGWKLQCSDYNSKYRTLDGSCNNPYHPYWGKAYTCHVRFLPPDYSDGLQAPRLATNGYPLPNPRSLSNIAHRDLPLDTYYTHMKMAWGQMVNHDISHTPVYGSYAVTSSYDSGLDCCKARSFKQCMAIDIPKASYDYLYNKYNNTCLNFVRSAPCPLCDMGPRQQLNIVTSFLDMSLIYGSSVNESVPLRSYTNGLLKVSYDRYNRTILPITDQPWQNECSPSARGMKCFLSGDQRVNQHPVLMLMHLLFVRRHNQHAVALKRVNPHWNDDRIFQEARRIIIAEFQHITYNEYLPILFGPTLSSYFSLGVGKYGQYTNYESWTDPTIWNEFSTVAGRFGHSQINGFFGVLSGIYGQLNYSRQSYWLRDRFFDPSLTYQGLTDGILRGLLTEHARSVDPHFSHDIKNYLFRRKGERFGSDLIARNIQRGRDHGIPGYINYLNFCFGFEVTEWNDLKRFIPNENFKLLRQLYPSFKDIDFYTGGISERHFPDADVGPTFGCILGIQYYHLKYGDRYFYEHRGQPGSFKSAQLDNIKRTTTLARILCRASDNLSAVQRYAFFPKSNYNRRVQCYSLPEIDYNLWKETY